MALWNRSLRLGQWALVACLCLALSACGSKVTKENYEKIKPGMTKKEVEAILGSPTKTVAMAMANIALWKDSNNVIWVSYKDGKVAHRMWFSADQFKADNPGGFGFQADPPARKRS
jgi:hypothetical protein